jgi:CRP/FNR family transcriptional regulator, cyclic AMP receptor protein
LAPSCRVMRKALFFLGILNDADVEWMISTGVKQRLNPGEVLIEEGQPAASIFLVLEGVLSVVAQSAGGQEIARLRSGEIVGEMSFVDSRPPSATVRAVEPSSVLVIPRRDLAERLSQDSHFAARFYRAIAVFLSDRLRYTVGRLGYGSGEPLEEQTSYAEEIDPAVLDNVSLAGARFEILQRRLRAI